uniref:Seven TM Receptor n=1 Tax=Caenorhabditis tropicalis TaxID=1561998 RepID=A0A1I7TYE2_9PELO
MIYFRGPYLFIWILYCSYFGFQYSIGTYYFLEFYNISFDYYKESVQMRYNVSLNEIPAMGMIAFDPNTRVLRWRNIMSVINIVEILASQYIIMICCGVKMMLELEHKIKNFSPILKRHHEQFFKTLIIQISAPTVTLFIPLLFIVCLPLFNLEVNMPLGFLLCSFTLYPAVDALIVMYVVSDYKRIVIKLWKRVTGKFKKPNTTSLELSSKQAVQATTV